MVYLVCALCNYACWFLNKHIWNRYHLVHIAVTNLVAQGSVGANTAFV